MDRITDESIVRYFELFKHKLSLNLIRHVFCSGQLFGDLSEDISIIIEICKKCKENELTLDQLCAYLIDYHKKLNIQCSIKQFFSKDLSYHLSSITNIPLIFHDVNYSFDKKSYYVLYMIPKKRSIIHTLNLIPSIYPLHISLSPFFSAYDIVIQKLISRLEQTLGKMYNSFMLEFNGIRVDKNKTHLIYSSDISLVQQINQTLKLLGLPTSLTHSKFNLHLTLNNPNIEKLNLSLLNKEKDNQFKIVLFKKDKNNTLTKLRSFFIYLIEVKYV